MVREIDIMRKGISEKKSKIYISLDLIISGACMLKQHLYLISLFQFYLILYVLDINDHPTIQT